MVNLRVYNVKVQGRHLALCILLSTHCISECGLSFLYMDYIWNPNYKLVWINSLSDTVIGLYCEGTRLKSCLVDIVIHPLYVWVCVKRPKL